MRVVLDTNVLVSAALKPDGLEAALVNLAVSGELEVWVTAAVWAEYDEVMARSKFAGIRAASRKILDALELRATRTTAVPASVRAMDEDDNVFIECAEAAQANFLVTGNLRHYPAEWGMTRAVNARGFFEATQAAGRSSSRADAELSRL